MKKRVALFFSFFLMLSVLIGVFAPIFCFAADTAPVTSTDMAEAICLYNIESGTTLYSKNTNKKIFPGSAVKMMTGLIACELLSARLEERVVITEDMLSEAEGASAKLFAGASVTLENLLYGVLCGGGNDAALALATVCSGSVDAFVDHMNATARQWGLRNTFFTNPTGLDDKKMYSTLSDLLIIARRACANNLYLDVSSAVSYTYTPGGSDKQIKLFNRNSLISTYYSYDYKNPSVSGLIAGNTELGGQCVITLAQRGSASYVCAVMGASDDGSRLYSYEIANSLISYAFENFKFAKIAEKGQAVCSLSVSSAISSNGELSEVRCVLRDDVYALISSDVDLSTQLSYRHYFHNQPISAPVDANTVVGGVDIMYNGAVLASGVLIAEDDVAANGFLLKLNSLKELAFSRTLWLCIAFCAISLTIYFLFFDARLRRKNVKKIQYKQFY